MIPSHLGPIGCLVLLIVAIVSANYNVSSSDTLTLVANGPYGGDVQSLKATFSGVGEVTRVTLRDASAARFEISNEMLVAPSSPSLPAGMSATLGPVGHVAQLSVEDSSGTSIWSAGPSRIVFEDQYLEVSTQISTNASVYGYGERVHSFRLKEGETYVIWNTDQGTPENLPLYGTHPVVVVQNPDGTAFGTAFLNASAQSMELTTDGWLTFRFTGGIIDFLAIPGPSPHNVIAKYTAVIGRPRLPPLWSLGHHQSRWGYKSWNETKTVLETYVANDIPIESMTNDIDWLANYRDFAFADGWDPVVMKKDLAVWAEQGYHYQMILDPAISSTGGQDYSPYTDLLSSGGFVKNQDNSPAAGKVWPGPTIFPDFSSSEGQKYWSKMVSELISEVPVSGLWIDMNEPASFNYQGPNPNNIGATTATAEKMKARHPAPVGVSPSAGDIKIAKELLDEDARKAGNVIGEPSMDAEIADMHLQNVEFDPVNPPFNPTGKPMNFHTLNMDTHTADGLFYDTHSTYGHYEGVATHSVMEKATGKRGFVISRSTMISSGRHVAHWLGDNNSDFHDLAYSIPGVLNMGIYGIQPTGADVCGFGGTTFPELCTRWYQMAVFSPWLRNHNTIGAPSQEAYLFTGVYRTAIRDALRERYQILPTLYSLAAEATTTGVPMIRALAFEMPQSAKDTAEIDHQVMVGPALMACPVTSQGAADVWTIFPVAERWFDVRGNYTEVTTNQSGSSTVIAKNPVGMDTIPLYMRGGYSVLLSGEAAHAGPSALMHKSSMSLVVALGNDGTSTGDFYVDDGESIVDPATSLAPSHTVYSLKGKTNAVSISSSTKGKGGPVVSIDTLTIVGLKDYPSPVVNGDSCASSPSTESGRCTYVFDKTANTVVIRAGTSSPWKFSSLNAQF